MTKLLYVGDVGEQPMMIRVAWEDRFDGMRFFSLVRKVWIRLPCWAQRLIVSLWARSPRRPRIELIRKWSLESGHSSSVLGQVSTGGLIIELLGSYFTQAPDKVIEALLAHEFAHVFQFAVPGGPAAWLCHDNASTEELEADADELARSWGFDVRLVYNWRVRR